MSWFSSSFSLPISSSQNEDDDRGEHDDAGEDLPSLKGVKEEFSELTKSITGQFWGVASFLAPPPVKRSADSPRAESAKNITPGKQTQSPKIVGTAEEDDRVVASGFDKEGKEDVGVLSDAASRMGSLSEVSGSLESGSPSTGGQRLTGFRSDFAELRGTMATGLSRIQSAVRVVREDDDSEEGDSEETSPKGSISSKHQSLEDASQRNTGLSSLFKPFVGRMLSYGDKPPEIEGREEFLLPIADDDEENEDDVLDKGTRLIASSFDGLSKIASNFLPFARDMLVDFPKSDYFAAGLTNEVVAFANNIAGHPETWLDFPLPEEEDDEFKMTEAQQAHADAVERLASRLAAVRYELCPAIISDGRFWKIYFVLLHSRLSKEDAEHLSTHQVLITRDRLLQEITKTNAVGSTQFQQRELGNNEFGAIDTNLKVVVVKDPLESTSQSKSSLLEEQPSTDSISQGSVEPVSDTMPSTLESEEVSEASAEQFSKLKLENDEADDVDAWLETEEDDVGNIGADGEGVMENIDVDVSFSDLEDDDDELKQGEGPEKPLEGTDIDEGAKTFVVEDGIHTTGGHSEIGDLQFPSFNDESSDEQTSTGSKIERSDFNDWLTVDEGDATSAASSSPV